MHATVEWVRYGRGVTVMCLLKTVLRDAGQHTGAMKPSTVDMAIKRWRRLVADEPGMRARQGELIQRLGESNWKLEG